MSSCRIWSGCAAGVPEPRCPRGRDANPDAPSVPAITPPERPDSPVWLAGRIASAGGTRSCQVRESITIGPGEIVEGDVASSEAPACRGHRMGMSSRLWKRRRRARAHQGT
jgi:hypothetical protein